MCFYFLKMTIPAKNPNHHFRSVLGHYFRMIGYAVLTIVFLVVAGFAFIKINDTHSCREALKKAPEIQLGMTESEVLAIMGDEGLSKHIDVGRAVYSYSCNPFSSDNVDIVFGKDRSVVEVSY